jgi:hypothetical protein
MSWVAAAVAGSAIVGGVVSSSNAKKGVKAQEKQNEANEAFIREQAINARNDAEPLYDAAQQNRGIGTQAALDTFAQTIPEQGRMLQDGNYQAQGQILAGLPQSNNALMGMPVDYSQLQAQKLDPNYDWARQQVPQFVNPELRQRTNPGEMFDGKGNVVVDPNYVPPSSGGGGGGGLWDSVAGGHSKIFKKLF